MRKKIFRYIQYFPMDIWYKKFRKDALDDIKSKVETASKRLDCRFEGVLTIWGGNVPDDRDGSFFNEKYETWLKKNAIGEYFFYDLSDIMFQLKEDAFAFKKKWL